MVRSFRNFYCLVSMVGVVDFWGNGRLFTGPVYLRFLLGNPLCSLGTTLRADISCRETAAFCAVKKRRKNPPPVSRRRPHDLGAARPQDPQRGGRRRFFLKMNTVHFLNGKTAFSISETLRRWECEGKRVAEKQWAVR